MNRNHEQLEEVREDMLDIENLLQLLQVNLQDGEEDSYIKRTVRLASKMIHVTSEKLNRIIEDCENN